MNDTKSGRIEYLDTARAYLIFLVILGHVLIVLNPGYDRLLLTAAQEFIASFHMPAFFVIHGVLLGEKNGNNAPPWRTITVRRARTLLVPYLFFETVGMVCRRILYGQPLMTGLYNMFTVRCNVGADWFLPALFMGSLLCSQWGIGRKPVVRILSVCAAVAAAMLMPDMQIGTVIGRGLLAYAFIMTGFLGRRFFTPEGCPSVGKTICAFLVTAVCAAVNMKWGTNDFYGCSVGNPVTLVAAGISGTYLILSLSRRLSWPVTQKIGTQTLIIMGTHQLVIYAMTALFPNMRGGNLLWGVLLLACIVIAEIPVVYILNRYCSPLLGRKGK